MIFVIIFIAALCIMIASLAGLLFAVARVGNWVQDNLVYLNTFAAGVFIVVAYNVLTEALEFSSFYTPTILAVVAGFGIFFLAEYFLPEAHCHHDDANCVHSSKDKRKAWKVLLSDGVHNMGDGILLVPVFLIYIQLGIIATIGIIIHELVQEVAEFFVLKQAGYTTVQALQRNFFVSGTILIGVVIGALLTGSELLLAPLIGFAAGGFLHIVFIDLIPLTVREARERKKYFEFFVAFSLGVALIATVGNLTERFLEELGLDGHGHLGSEHIDHEEDEHIDHEEDEHIDHDD